MEKLIRLLQNFATGRRVAVLFVPTLALYCMLIFVTLPAVTALSPQVRVFDLSPLGYTLADAQRILAAIGEQGRDTYLLQQLPLDFIYPGLFAITYTLMLIWLFGKAFRPESKLFYLAFVPAVAGLFDYLENLGIIRMLYSYPDLSPTLVSLTSACTVLKSLLTLGFYLLLVIGVVPLLQRRFHA